MIKDNQLYYESGEAIQLEDYIHVITPVNESLILHFTKIPAGIMIVNGVQQPNYTIGFLHRNSGQSFQPEQLQDCKLYEVIKVKGETVNYEESIQ